MTHKPSLKEWLLFKVVDHIHYIYHKNLAFPGEFTKPLYYCNDPVERIKLLEYAKSCYIRELDRCIELEKSTININKNIDWM